MDTSGHVQGQAQGICKVRCSDKGGHMWHMRQGQGKRANLSKANCNSSAHSTAPRGDENAIMNKPSYTTHITSCQPWVCASISITADVTGTSSTSYTMTLVNSTRQHLYEYPDISSALQSTQATVGLHGSSRCTSLHVHVCPATGYAMHEPSSQQ